MYKLILILLSINGKINKFLSYVWDYTIFFIIWELVWQTRGAPKIRLDNTTMIKDDTSSCRCADKSYAHSQHYEKNKIKWVNFNSRSRPLLFQNHKWYTFCKDSQRIVMLLCLIVLLSMTIKK